MPKLVTDTVFLEKISKYSETYMVEACDTSSDRRRWSLFKNLCMLTELKWDLWLWGIKGLWLPGLWVCAEGLFWSHSFFLIFPKSCLQCWDSVPYSAIILLKHAYSVKINIMHFCVLVAYGTKKKKKKVKKLKLEGKTQMKKNIFTRNYLWFIVNGLLLILVLRAKIISDKFWKKINRAVKYPTY